MTEPATSKPLHQVHAEIDAFGAGVLTVDGHDLSESIACGGVTIQAGDRTRQTKVYLELNAGVTFDGPAEVTVLQGPHTVEFLQSVNPRDLSKRALARSFNDTPITSALAVLIEMAQQKEAKPS